MPPRFAIYYTPEPDSLWWQAGSQWLGRCARDGQSLEQPEIAGWPAQRLAELTRDPRRYGWHATLKAPFRLAERRTEQDLEAAVADLAGRHRPMALQGLQLTRLGQFIALCLPQPLREVQAFADHCVQDLHHLAAALDDLEIARRRRSALTPRQDELMLRWGYPYVLEEFRFHCTLSDNLQGVPESEQMALWQAAQSHFASLPTPDLAGVSIFCEPGPGQPFVWRSYWPLSGEGA